MATFTHQKAPVKKTIPARVPVQKVFQPERPSVAISAGTRQTKASGSRMPEAKISLPSVKLNASGKAAAPARPENARRPSRRGVKTRGRAAAATAAGADGDEAAAFIRIVR